MTKKYLLVVYTDAFEKLGPFDLEKDRLTKAAEEANACNEDMLAIYWLDVFENGDLKVDCYDMEELDG